MSRSPIRSMAAAVAALAAVLLATPMAGEGAAQATHSAPMAVISDTVDEVLEVLNDASLSSAARRSRIEEIAYRRFDFGTMSRLVVARYWKRFTPAQQEELVREFKEFLARTYGDRIDRYNQEQIEIVGERQEPRGDVSVLTRIVGGEYDSAEVHYRLRGKDARWRIIDVKIEGISLVLNYRDQFKAVLSRGGPEGLLEALSKKNIDAATNES
ncbi:MAG: ABC transporter substrate-binding protein [Deltaproteobacteria bacterium]|nr:ABC transporter substrate-binding protein [Deltaproteobacteria bacterium]